MSYKETNNNNNSSSNNDNNSNSKDRRLKGKILNRGGQKKQQTKGQQTKGDGSSVSLKRGNKGRGRTEAKGDRLSVLQKSESRGNRNNESKSRAKKGVLKVIPLGGLNEIGKNMTALEYNNTIVIVDCGMSFPEDEMFGIDIVIPNFDYLVENSEKVKGMILTHGHEDHIGAIPYCLKRVRMPVYGTRLTLGLVKNKLEEHEISADFKIINAGSKINIGPFDIEAIRVKHSIADSLCFSINTPIGTIFHTGDFKIDYTPVDGEPIDFQKLAEIGNNGVLAMFSDSTNAVKKGFTASEKNIGRVLDGLFEDPKGRIIIGTFASNVHRIQSIINTSIAHGRKVAVSGRSMVNVLALAKELGYLKVTEKMLVDVNETNNIPDNKLTILTTGSQGEPMSALARMASGNHKAIKIKKGDRVILSSTPIPGNEKTVAGIVNKLFELGADVIYSDIADIHVSGHACQEEIKIMLSLIKPKYYIPVHGEYRHLHQNAAIAESLGISKKNIKILENGQILEVTPDKVSISKKTVNADPVFVDGLGVGDVGDVVLNDRRLLSESGLIVVAIAVDRSSGKYISGPDVFSRGFVYVAENAELIKDARDVVSDTLKKCMNNGVYDMKNLKGAIIKDLRRYIYDRTQRNPMILPYFMEV